MTEEELEKYKNRLMSKTIKKGDCIEFTGSLQTGGYGQMGVFGKPKLTHRLSYEWFVGPIPEGMELDHLCKNKKCLNIKHLEPVSHQENLLRRELKKKERAERTHCRNGHELTPENTYTRSNGLRFCQTCRKRTRTH